MTHVSAKAAEESHQRPDSETSVCTLHTQWTHTEAEVTKQVKGLVAAQMFYGKLWSSWYIAASSVICKWIATTYLFMFVPYSAPYLQKALHPLCCSPLTVLVIPFIPPPHRCQMLSPPPRRRGLGGGHHAGECGQGFGKGPEALGAGWQSGCSPSRSLPVRKLRSTAKEQVLVEELQGGYISVAPLNRLITEINSWSIHVPISTYCSARRWFMNIL